MSERVVVSEGRVRGRLPTWLAVLMGITVLLLLIQVSMPLVRKVIEESAGPVINYEFPAGGAMVLNANELFPGSTLRIQITRCNSMNEVVEYNVIRRLERDIGNNHVAVRMLPAITAFVAPGCEHDIVSEFNQIPNDRDFVPGRYRLVSTSTPFSPPYAPRKPSSWSTQWFDVKPPPTG
jgi:hypothetical protein